MPRSPVFFPLLEASFFLDKGLLHSLAGWVTACYTDCDHRFTVTNILSLVSMVGGSAQCTMLFAFEATTLNAPEAFCLCSSSTVTQTGSVPLCTVLGGRLFGVKFSLYVHKPGYRGLAADLFWTLDGAPEQKRNTLLPCSSRRLSLLL